MKVKVNKKPTKNSIYVVLTDKGYLIGDVAVGVTFTDNKNEARKFSYDEACLYKQSILADITEFYNCRWMEFNVI